MTDTDCIVQLNLVLVEILNLPTSFIGHTICVYLCQLHIWIFLNEDPSFKNNCLKFKLLNIVFS